MTMIRVPRTFYDDHRERDLPTPVDHGRARRYAIIRTDDPATAELLSDAEYYADSHVAAELRTQGYGGLVRSAQATVRALRAAGAGENDA